ncbi:hypothetical protein FB45DRAFT_1124467 [Roridomyces roridus]|uniref:SET domain-containing protein n=1 Tax=Roridomyces roridus TaxID=1738132 RepID=A0AAD7C743_9AGAR|nr:hypothetical protein FB45DRAFT_1124467 [Roridomyces roridus]
MKRGFLNSSKAKARPLGSPAPPAPAPNVIISKPPIGKQNVEVPEGYDSELKLKEVHPSSGSVPGGITFTTVPFSGEPRTECIFHPGSKEVLMRLPGFSQPMVMPVGRNSPIRVKEVPGMGLGRPLLVAAQVLPTWVPPTFTPEQQGQYLLNHLEKFVAVAVGRMTDEDKAAYKALKNSHLEDGSGPLVGILRTNGLGIEGLRPDVTDGSVAARCTGVCEKISRLNHSCSPNVRTHWSMITFSFQLFAVRDIAADEELTYLYTGIEGSTAQRNEDLKPYDFVCTCSSCKDPKSDARRADLEKSGPPSISLWLFDDAPQATGRILDECRRQMAIIEREGMEAVFRYYEVLSVGFVVCVATGDAQSASEWARKLARIRWVEEVPKDIESFVDPNSRAYKTHPMWRKRFDRDSKESWDAMMKGLTAMRLGGIIL